MGRYLEPGNWMRDEREETGTGMNRGASLSGEKKYGDEKTGQEAKEEPGG